MMRYLRGLILLILLSSLTGCFYWVRAYQTYLQMDEFDQHFSITVADEFSINFNDPILYSDDFISLSKLQPSSTMALLSGKKWRYWFRKIDEQGRVIQPEIKFYFDLTFNNEARLTRWSFSPLFLKIAPAQFLEISLRSLGGAKINKEKRQIKANMDLIKKISADLPQKEDIVDQLGEPLEIESQKDQEIYKYHFKLETHNIKKGYEDRALNVLKLTFDKVTDELIKMSGRFVGMKISIKYRKYLKEESQYLVGLENQNSK